MALPITCDDLPQLMGEVRIMARRLLRRERHAEALQTTSLVLTALRRQGRKGQDWSIVTWDNRRHFFGSVYRAMQQALVDRARARQRRERAGFAHSVSIDELLPKDVRYLVQETPAVVQALLTALRQLQAIEPTWAEAFEHHFFGGLTWQETAQLVGVNERTLRNWRERAYDLLGDEIRRILHGEA